MAYKNKLLFSCLSFVVFYSASQAQVRASDFDWSANVGVVNQYSFRGLAQSDEMPALQGGFDVSHSSGLYAGLWGSNVDFNDGDEASVEIDLFAGYSGSIDAFSYDLGVIYYGYPGADSSLDYDFWEGSVALGYDFGVASATATVNYSPEFFAHSGDALYYGASVDVPLPHDFSLSAHVGHQTISDNGAFGYEDYTDWSVGAGYTYQGFDFSVQYVDTDLDEPSECADGCAERVVFGISRTF